MPGLPFLLNEYPQGKFLISYIKEHFPRNKLEIYFKYINGNFAVPESGIKYVLQHSPFYDLCQHIGEPQSFVQRNNIYLLLF